MQATPRKRGRAAVNDRRRWLNEHPLCKRCLERGHYRPGDEVDHVIPLSQGGADDDTNKQTLCNDCHTEKSIRERGDRFKAGADVSGWPMDAAHHWNTTPLSKSLG